MCPRVCVYTAVGPGSLLMANTCLSFPSQGCCHYGRVLGCVCGGGPRVSTLTNRCWHRPDEAALRALPAQPRPWPQGVGNAFKLRFPNLRQPTPPPDGPSLTWPAPPDQHNLLALPRGSCSLRLTPSWRPSLTTLERSLATWLLSYAGMYLSFFPLFLAELCAVS